jgi:hypothetical protein
LQALHNLSPIRDSSPLHEDVDTIDILDALEL